MLGMGAERSDAGRGAGRGEGSEGSGEDGGEGSSDAGSRSAPGAPSWRGWAGGNLRNSLQGTLCAVKPYIYEDRNPAAAHAV